MEDGRPGVSGANVINVIVIESEAGNAQTQNHPSIPVAMIVLATLMILRNVMDPQEVVMHFSRRKETFKDEKYHTWCEKR